MTGRRLRLLGLALGVFMLSGCATTGPARHAGEEPAPVGPFLLVGSPEYHLEANDAGQVFLIRASDEGLRLDRREIDSYEEFRTLYEVGERDPLPPELPTEGLLVNGWRGQECLRAAHVCGTAPAEPLHGLSPVQVLLKFGLLKR